MSRPTYYRETEDGVEPLPDAMTWAVGFERGERWNIQTVISDRERVSTCFLGIDHNFFGKGPPLLYETIVFGGPFAQWQDRYETRQEAEAGHAEMVARVRSRWNRWRQWMRFWWEGLREDWHRRRAG